jgi:hypothetical protein
MMVAIVIVVEPGTVLVGVKYADLDHVADLLKVDVEVVVTLT